MKGCRMALETKITQSLGQGYVQIDATNRYGYTQYYKVPQKKARKFAYELKTQDKTLNLYSNIAYFSAIIAGVLGASIFTKNMESRWKQFGIQSLSAIGLSTLTAFGMTKYTNNEKENLIKSYKAKEIFYRA